MLISFFESTTQTLTINTNHLKGIGYNISIFDNTGKLFYTKNGDVENAEVNQQVNCASFSSGLFIAKFSTGQEQLVKKFMKN